MAIILTTEETPQSFGQKNTHDLPMKNRIKSIIDQSIESLSLTIFLLYIHLADMNARADWLLPYLLASTAGLGAMVYVYRRGLILNRLFIGITLYFCSGLVSLITGWDWLNQAYGELGAVAMLGWILLTGLVASVASPHGFLGVRSPRYFSIPGGSCLLLLAGLLATAGAASFMNNPLFGQWLPFIFLFSMRSLLLHLDKKMLTATATAA
ncbi:MAG TPA: hypothetical protein DIW64_04590 [Cellvibrio sp.]|nr:hypothetical protein [Cellvibrio sp.]